MNKNHLKALIAFCKEETIGLKYINGQGIKSFFPLADYGCNQYQEIEFFKRNTNHQVIIKEIFKIQLIEAKNKDWEFFKNICYMIQKLPEIEKDNEKSFFITPGYVFLKGYSIDEFNKTSQYAFNPDYIVKNNIKQLIEIKDTPIKKQKIFRFLLLLEFFTLSLRGGIFFNRKIQDNEIKEIAEKIDFKKYKVPDFDTFVNQSLEEIAKEFCEQKTYKNYLKLKEKIFDKSVEFSKKYKEKIAYNKQIEKYEKILKELYIFNQDIDKIQTIEDLINYLKENITTSYEYDLENYNPKFPIISNLRIYREKEKK